MHADIVRVDTLARHEISFRIIDYFIGIDIGMIVRSGNRLRVVIEESGYEGADHKISPLEGLVGWWRLMYPSGDGFEILDVENPGIQITIQPDNVDGIGVKDMRGPPVAQLMGEH